MIACLLLTCPFLIVDAYTDLISGLASIITANAILLAYIWKLVLEDEEFDKRENKSALSRLSYVSKCIGTSGAGGKPARGPAVGEGASHSRGASTSSSPFHAIDNVLQNARNMFGNASSSPLFDLVQLEETREPNDNGNNTNNSNSNSNSNSHNNSNSTLIASFDGNEYGDTSPLMTGINMGKLKHI